MKDNRYIKYVEYCVDQYGNDLQFQDMPHDAHLIGWDGIGPKGKTFVAVWNDHGLSIGQQEAIQIAHQCLIDESATGKYEYFENPHEFHDPDHVI